MIELSSKEKKIFKEAREFSLEKIYPKASFWENNPNHSQEAMKLLVDAGYSGLNIPEKLGGRGYNFLETALAYEGLAYGDAAVPSSQIQLHNNILYILSNFYDKNKIIKEIYSEIIKGNKLLAFALTEEHSGSDPSSMRSYAELKEDGYHIHGKKAWIFNSQEADYFIITVKENSPESNEMIMLLVDKDNPGLKVSEPKLLLGNNCISCCDIFLDDCIVPEDRLLSKKAFKEALKLINLPRTFVPAIAIGMAQRVIDLTVDYLKERELFNKPIIDNQGIQWELSELLARVEAGRWLVYRTASMMDKENIDKILLAKNKLYCTDVAMDTTIQCLQFFGAEGYGKDSVLARYMTVAKLLQIVDGTSEIQKIIIGRNFNKN